MENQQDYENYLKARLSVDASDIEVPDLRWVHEARKKVAAKKRFDEENTDVFVLLATFLNMKIKLYHAVLASILVAFLIVYFTKSSPSSATEAGNVQYVSNIAAVRNSTVLSSIRTFAIKN